MAKTAMLSLRKLPPIPADPKPSRKQVDAELRKRSFVKSIPRKRQREFAAFFWEADQRQKYPDLFWHPFAPEPMWYEAYLNSDEWGRISKQVKKEAGNKCACCPDKATQVHHRCYRPRVLSGMDTSLLIALCHTCHKTVDFDDRSKVRDAHSKERVLAELFAREAERLARGSV